MIRTEELPVRTSRRSSAFAAALSPVTRLERAGPTLLVVALLALGLRGLATASLVPAWQPAPAGGMDVHVVAVSDGVALVVLATMALTRRWKRLGAWGLTLLLSAWVVLLQTPGLILAPDSVVLWLAVAEVGAVACGTALVACSAVRPGGAGHATTAARTIFGLCAIIFGLSHFVYVAFTAGMVPAWLPMRTALAYGTGVAHAAAGIAIATGVLRRLAATLLAAMMGLFAVLVHIPAVLATHGSLVEITFLCNACALCGAAWTVAVTSPRATATPFEVTAPARHGAGS